MEEQRGRNVAVAEGIPYMTLQVLPLHAFIVEKLTMALELYRQGRASKSKAAALAGISLWEMMDLIEREGTPSSYTLQEAVEEVRRLVVQISTPP